MQNIAKLDQAQALAGLCSIIISGRLSAVRKSMIVKPKPDWAVGLVAEGSLR